MAKQGHDRPWRKVADLRLHPEVRRLIPPLSPEQLQALRESIDRLGVLMPLLVYEDQDGVLWVIDGKHRLEIARELGLEWVPVEILYVEGGLSAEDIELRAIEANLERRQLCKSQQAVLALGVLKREEALAKERQRRGAQRGGQMADRRRLKGAAETGRPDESAGEKHAGEAAERAAQRTGISARTLQKAKKALELRPDLREPLLNCEMSVDKAYRVAMGIDQERKTVYLVIHDPQAVEVVETSDPCTLPADKLALKADGWDRRYLDWKGEAVKPLDYLRRTQSASSSEMGDNETDVD